MHLAAVIVLGICTVVIILYLHALVYLTIKTYVQTRRQLKLLYNEKKHRESIFIFSDNDLEIKIIDNQVTTYRIVTAYSEYKQIKFYEKDVLIEAINLINQKVKINNYDQLISEISY